MSAPCHWWLPPWVCERPRLTGSLLCPQSLRAQLRLVEEDALLWDRPQL